MVERRVEDTLGGIVRRLDAHLRQFVVPGLVGGQPRRLEVPSGELRLEVGLGAFDAHGRQGHLHEQLLALRHVEIHAGIAGRDPGHLGVIRLTRLQVGDSLCRLRKLGHEVDLLIPRPAH